MLGEEFDDFIRIGEVIEIGSIGCLYACGFLTYRRTRGLDDWQERRGRDTALVHQTVTHYLCEVRRRILACTLIQCITLL